jgi:subfamily B ATP-binding cassette protein MsbA
MEEYEKKRFSAENLKLLKILLKKLKNNALSSPVMEVIGGLAAAAVIFYGGWNVLNGNSTPGTFFSFVTAMLLLYGPAKNINKSYQDIQDGLAAAKRVFEIFDTEPEVKEKPDAVSIQCKHSAVTFNNVTFSYDKDPVLHNIDLKVKPHETIAIVGMTGSSKTTLVNLIPRFYDVDSGSIQIDGIDIQDVTLKSLRSQISIVNQHPYLFNDSLKNNIAYGDNTQSMDKIIEAVHAACAHQFINEMPDKYDTVIGEHGVKLSGGQRQRIAIARAILKDAPILIFDEATSSLDTNLEREIQVSLEKLIKNKTTIIIAHRLSTIRNADRIIVLSKGRIVEQGSHDKLFQQKGEYSKLYSIYAQKEQKQS